MSLSYFFVGAFADGVEPLDSSKLVAEPDDTQAQLRSNKTVSVSLAFFFNQNYFEGNIQVLFSLNMSKCIVLTNKN